MKKKILALVLVMALVVSVAIGLAACNDDTDQLTFGLICLHDENSTYDKNFIDAAREAAEVSPRARLAMTRLSTLWIRAAT